MTPLSKAKNRERMKQARVQPKYPVGYMWPDGRCRLPDMRLVQPKDCQMVGIIDGVVA